MSNHKSEISPELLEACTAALDVLYEISPGDGRKMKAISALEAAIAKAEKVH
jgi:hypothetical protein